MKNIKKNFGFTLIELLIYIAFISISISAAILFAFDILYSKEKASIKQAVAHSLLTANERISLEIREASSINSVSANSISLANSNASRNPTVIDLSSGRIRIGYGASGSCPTSSPRYLTPDDITVSTLAFTNLSSGGAASIGWNMTFTSSANRNEYTESQTTQNSAELRNNE